MQKLTALVLLLLLVGCGEERPYVARGVWGEVSMTGEFCAWRYTPGGSAEMFAANGDFLSRHRLESAGLRLGCVKDGPEWFYQTWRDTNVYGTYVYATFDGVYGFWDDRGTGPVKMRAAVSDNTFTLNGRSVPLTTIVTIAGFPGHMYTGAFDVYGEFYELPPGVDPASLDWQMNSMGRFAWQQDTLSLPEWVTP